MKLGRINFICTHTLSNITECVEKGESSFKHALYSRRLNNHIKTSCHYLITLSRIPQNKQKWFQENDEGYGGGHFFPLLKSTWQYSSNICSEPNRK